MIARTAKLCGLASLCCCLACDDPRPEEQSTTDSQATSAREEPVVGAACEAEGGSRCGADGSEVFTCEAAVWTSRTCRQTCKQTDLCALGCLITSATEECLCFASELPCSS